MNLTIETSILQSWEKKEGKHGQIISFIYPLFIYLEQPHFINSHYYFKNNSSFNYYCLKRGESKSEDEIRGEGGLSSTRKRKNQNQPHKYLTNHHKDKRDKRSFSHLIFDTNVKKKGKILSFRYKTRRYREECGGREEGENQSTYSFTAFSEHVYRTQIHTT